MNDHTVLIAGAGPTGMMLAGELALAGVDVAILERRANTDLSGSRAGGLHARTLEIFDQRGIADRFVAEGKPMQTAGFSGITLDISDFPTRFNHGLALWQKHIERILAGWIDELGVPVQRGVEVRGCTQDDSGVDVELADGTRRRAQYLVGCDGGGSAIRKSAGIAFPGTEPTVSNIIAEANLAADAPWGVRRDQFGIHGMSKLEDRGLVRIMVTEKQVGAGGEPSLDELSEAMIAIYGSDFGVHRPTWISRFTDMTRQAAAYRDRRVLLAGDAAHVHPPDGGQGIQTGVQDAVNLGWKLAQVLNGASDDSLLDTYHAERHPVAARVLRHTLASVALRREDERTQALRGMIADLLAVEQARKNLAATLTELDIRYELGTPEELAAHPLLGRRMPDLDLGDGARVFTLLHGGRSVLLRFRASDIDASPWVDRIDEFDVRHPGAWELPALGAIDGPSAVLIRPDGHVAWVGAQGSSRLSDALTTWCGPPS
ncbi:MAG TPA: FAD-dependent monooxygenase [Steroidobacteraceae bacterium]|nr:FAD-dependent monooxygenase [Steroidobacteraceae bacterium]